jgi:AbrB family looped-hinge helix DNA binding protein
MDEKAVLDEKGRVLIPKSMREKLGLHEGVKLKLSVEDGKIVITKLVSPEEFIGDMEGFIGEDTAIPKIDPLRLKEIWGKT